ncbi:FdtA/QdtA family cupin domain-containing protein [Undibacterium sp.]|uniref:sugar 3,4-ketoisomerase n=1 Tax=Undibacterium sp. TaxID=1914977 RepID=UPI00345BCA13
MFGTKEGVERGFHAHKNLQQVAVAVCGSCTMVLDNGVEKIKVQLNNPTQGIYIDTMLWHFMKHFTEDCVLLGGQINNTLTSTIFVLILTFWCF